MSALLSLLKSPFKFKLFLIKKLPMAYLAGLKVKEISFDRSVITIPYKYLTQNPFRSIYFACLSMAAEMASGALSLIHISNSRKPVSMLVVNMQADFSKKAKGIISFNCEDGDAIKNAIEESIKTGEGRTITATSLGIDESGEKVAEFKITWSYKAKNS